MEPSSRHAHTGPGEGDSRMPAVKNVGEPCAGEPHARLEVAAGGNRTSRAITCRAAQAPPVDPPIRVAERPIRRGGEGWWRCVTPCGVAVGDCAVCEGCAAAFWGCRRAAVLGPG